MIGNPWLRADPRVALGEAPTQVGAVTDGTHVREGVVETEHGYHVEIVGGALSGLTWIGRDDSWPEHWRWIGLPR